MKLVTMLVNDQNLVIEQAISAPIIVAESAYDLFTELISSYGMKQVFYQSTDGQSQGLYKSFVEKSNGAENDNTPNSVLKARLVSALQDVAQCVDAQRDIAIATYKESREKVDNLEDTRNAIINLFTVVDNI